MSVAFKNAATLGAQRIAERNQRRAAAGPTTTGHQPNFIERVAQQVSDKRKAQQSTLMGSPTAVAPNTLMGR